VALCIGIDNYPEFDDRLGGCIADTNRWAAALAELGFETRIRLDGDATRDAIEAELLRLMRESRPGDHIVFQYAGHGMSIPDLNGDEVDGNDESLCPWDFRDGRLWLDDDIARLVDRLPQGVAFTWFTDSCHSQSNTRVAALAGTNARGAGLRVRQAKVTPATLDAHRRDRQARGGWRAAIADDRGALDVSRQRIAKFAACRDDQLAWEEGGSGVFTRAAVPLLRQAVEAGISNNAFLGLIVEHMGTGGRQEPWLDCEHGLRSAALLGASSGRVGAGDAPSGVAVPAASAAAGVRDVALHHLARAMFALTATTDRLS
jgi:Caspase domain